VFWFLFKKGGNEKDDSSSSIIDEYNLFYEKEVLKKDQQKPEDDKILFTDESNIVINAVSKLQFNLLDFKEIEGLPYSCEKISKTIIHQLAYSKDLTSVDRKILILKLSYLYKPKEQLRQRMFDEYVITEFRKLDVTWKYTIRTEIFVGINM
jgi:hypothetical protein